MQRTESQPTASFFWAAVVFGLIEATLFGWLMYRGRETAAFLVLLCLGALDTLILGSRWDWALILRHGGDERQKRVADRAGRAAFLLILVTCLVGALWETGVDGDPGPFALIAGIAIAAYLVSVAVLVRRS